jgi:hypothetical protein
MIPYVRPAVVDSRHPFLREPHRRPLRVFVDPLILEPPDATASAVGAMLLSLVDHLAKSPWVELVSLDLEGADYEGELKRLRVDRAADVVRLCGDLGDGRTRRSIGADSELKKRADVVGARTAASVACRKLIDGGPW